MILLTAFILTVSIAHAWLVCLGLKRSGVASLFDYFMAIVFWGTCWPIMSTVVMYRAVTEGE